MPVVIILDNSVSATANACNDMNYYQLNSTVLKEFISCLQFVSPNEQIAMLHMPTGLPYELTAFSRPHSDLYEEWMVKKNLGGMAVFDIYTQLENLLQDFSFQWPTDLVPLDIIVFTRGGAARGIINPLLKDSHNRSHKVWGAHKRCCKFTLLTWESQISTDFHELLQSQAPNSRHLQANLAMVQEEPDAEKATWARHLALKLLLGCDQLSNSQGAFLQPETSTSNKTEVSLLLNESCITMVVGRLSCAGSVTCRSYVSLSPPVIWRVEPHTSSSSSCWIAQVDAAVRSQELCFDIVGFLNYTDVKAPRLSSRHAMWPVLFDEGTHSCHFTRPAQSVREESHLMFLLRQTLFSSPNLVALCAVDFLSNAGQLEVNSQSPPRRWAFVSCSGGTAGVSGTGSKTTTGGSGMQLVISFLEEGAHSVPWLGKLAYLAPISLFEESPYRDEKRVTPFPVCSGIRMSYTPATAHSALPATVSEDLSNIRRSWISHTTWTNITNACNEVVRFVRMCRKVNEANVPSLYKETNRIRVAACLYGFTEVLEYIESSLQAEMEQFNTLAQTHAKHIIASLQKDPKLFISPPSVSVSAANPTVARTETETV